MHLRVNDFEASRNTGSPRSARPDADIRSCTPDTPRSLAIDRQRFGSSLGGLIQLLAIHSAHRVGDVRVAADVPPHRRNDEKSPDRELGDQDSILA
jgi:hypothetical protein